MKIEVTGTSVVQGGSCLLRDLARYNTVARWLNAVITKKSSWHPKNVRVRYKNEQYNIMQGGDVVPDADEIIKWFVRTIVNDVIDIKADIVKSELYINLDCED